MTDTKKRRWLIAASAVGLLAVVGLIVGLTTSYLTDRDANDNVFALGNVQLTLTEEHYPEQAQDRILAPKAYIPKDPVIVNTGNNDEYVFLKVTLPLESVTIVDETTHKPKDGGKVLREVFNLLSDDAAHKTAGFSGAHAVEDIGELNYDSHWSVLSGEEDLSNQTHTYLFGYRQMLGVGSQTTALFDRLQIRNVLEGDLLPEQLQRVEIAAYGIQKEELEGWVTVADPDHVTDAELKGIFDIYAGQEGS